MVHALIIGGTGRIGSRIAQDVLAHTSADVIVTGRNSAAGAAAIATLGSRSTFRVLDLADRVQLRQLIAEADLVIHSAGPFHHCDTRVLQTCIEQQVNYLDVSDERTFTLNALSDHEAAQSAGITAVINTGVFPGISNSLARQGVEHLDSVESVHLSYAVTGSGDAGLAAMRTTFIGLQHPFDAWIDGQWKPVKPYTGAEVLPFPAPYGPVQVYWYDMPEGVTLPRSLPVKQVVTKFGVVPRFYNHLTWMAAHWFPPSMLRQPLIVEFLSRVSNTMTNVTDRFTGTGVAVRCEVRGQKQGRTAHYHSSFVHDSAAVATATGTGIIAQLILNEGLHKPGVWSVEQVLSTEHFERAIAQRHLNVRTEMQS